jgi:hypothetical protein
MKVIYLHNNTDQQFSAIQHHHEYAEQYEHLVYLDHLNYMPEMKIMF